MNLNITYRHVESTPSIEEKIRDKASKIEKYFDKDVNIDWVCTVDKNQHTSEVNVHASGKHFHAKSEEDSLYKTFDGALQKLEGQIRKSHK